VYSLVVTGHFDAAHHLPGHKGPCANIHGHSFQVEIKVSGKDLNGMGMLVDFQDIKAAWKRYDHQDLNNFFIMPTAEHIAAAIFKELNTYDHKVKYVRIWESSDCYAEYMGD